MAHITATLLTSSGTSSATNALGTVATASITPSASKLVIVAVVQNRDGTTVPNTPSVSGCSMTWTQVVTNTYTSSDNDRHRITLFRGISSSPTAGALSISQGGGNCQDLYWSVVEFKNVVPSGTNGADGIVQSTTAGTTGSTLNITLSSFASTHNGTFAVVYHNGSGTVTADSDLTTLANYQDAHRIVTQFVGTPQTTVTYGANVGMTGASVELKANFSGAGILMQM